MGAHFAPPEVEDLDLARSLTARRALEDAIDHGTAMLAALGLAPLRSMTRAIALLDALDALGEDLEPDVDLEDGADDEPTLGAPENHPGKRWYLDMEETSHRPTGLRLGDQTSWARGFAAEHEDEPDHDGEPEAGYDLAEGDDELDGPYCVDDENSLGWPNSVSQLKLSSLWDRGDELETTAIETHGKGFRRSGPDDAEDDGTAEECHRLYPMAHPGDGLDRVWLRADRLFGMRVVGNCCSPSILDGASIHLDKDAQPEPGDFVSLFFEAERHGVTEMISWVKRLVAGLPTGMALPQKCHGDELLHVVMIESLNPPKCYAIPCDKIHAMFKVVAVIPPAEAIAARTQQAALHR